MGDDLHLIGFAFNRSFSSAADTMTHGALALAMTAGALAWRAHRGAGRRPGRPTVGVA